MSYLFCIDDFSKPLQNSYWSKIYSFKSFKVYMAYRISSQEWRWQKGVREIVLCTTGEDFDNLIDGKLPTKKEVSVFHSICFDLSEAFYTKDELESYKKYLKMGKNEPIKYML